MYIGGQNSQAVLTCGDGVGLAFVGVINLTIKNVLIKKCGLSGIGLKETYEAINITVSAFFEVPTSLGVALTLGDVSSADINNLTIQDTVGFGLLGINIIGNSHITSGKFVNTTYQNCTIGILSLREVLMGPYRKQIGGGAFLAYFDYRYHKPVIPKEIRLEITSCSFQDNQDCGLTGTLAWRMKYSSTLLERGHTIGGGGGLSIVLSQTGYSANVFVKSSVLKKKCSKLRCKNAACCLL